MIFGRRQLWLAFESGAVCALRLAPAWRGARVEAFGRVALAPGALDPNVGGPVLNDADAVRAATAAALESVAGTRARLHLVVPEGLARLMLLERLPEAIAPAEYARFRLAQVLPYPVAEAVVGVLPLGGGRGVAAALRRDVVAAFEALVSALGARPGGVYLESLLTLASVSRSVPRDGVAALLGDTTLTLAAYKAGLLVALRQRLRAVAGEADELVSEARRTATLCALAAETPLFLAGPGARALHHRLLIDGHEAQLLGLGVDGAPEAAHELAWLKGAVA